ncbi:MAG: 4-hydroxy-tetrahydrodipicolinate reductase [Bacteroidales bacterium]|jgi:4-hydroxy-tetrahydrodipicolinate reductase|nr:4-hydroxy-tetrahydrodipicolinate reductase [Bacteroidales bacterium]
MKIALLGYGRMGREVEQVALAGGHEIVLKTDISSQDGFNRQTAPQCDVAIEFTGPEAAADTIIKAITLGLPVVSGSTGWLTRYDEVVKLCVERDGSFIHSPNFSIGVNILSRLNSELARIMMRLPEYRPEIGETHHASKKDTPSGTAIMLAEQIVSEHGGYTGWRRAGDRPGQGTVPVISVREGTVPGSHTVTWKSDHDIISLSHEAINRSGFAHGAIMAAEYISTRRGVFTMADILNII